MDFDEIHHFGNFQCFLKGTVIASHVAATLWVSATVLTAGNAFSDTIKRVCKKKFYNFEFKLTKFWVFSSRKSWKSWKSSILIEIDQNITKSLISRICEVRNLKIRSFKVKIVKFRLYKTFSWCQKTRFRPLNRWHWPERSRQYRNRFRNFLDFQDFQWISGRLTELFGAPESH